MAKYEAQEAPRGSQVATSLRRKSGDMSPSQPLVLRSGPGAQNGPLGLRMAAWGPFGHS